MTVNVVELHYTVAELAILLRFSVSTIRRYIRDGDFSDRGADGAPDFSNITDVNGDLRVPTSGVLLFKKRHPFVYDLGVRARNGEELRRKLGRKAGGVGAATPYQTRSPDA